MSDENTETSYIDAIPEEYRDVASVRDAGSMENLLKQHVNLESKLGNSISFPTDDADEDQLNNFYSKIQERAAGLTRIPTAEDSEEWAGVYDKLGRPKDPSEYQYPEIKYDDNGVEKPLDQSKYGEGFQTKAHELGITGKQFKGIMSYFGEQTLQNMEQRNAEYETTMNALRSEWGDSTDARVARVQALVKEQGGDEAANAFGDLGNNPAVLAMLDKMADALMEENSLGNQGPTGDAATRSAIEDEIATLKKNGAFLDGRDPDHERTVKRVDDLYAKLEKFKVAA